MSRVGWGGGATDPAPLWHRNKLGGRKPYASYRPAAHQLAMERDNGRYIAWPLPTPWIFRVCQPSPELLWFKQSKRVNFRAEVRGTALRPWRSGVTGLWWWGFRQILRELFLFPSSQNKTILFLILFVMSNMYPWCLPMRREDLARAWLCMSSCLWSGCHWQQGRSLPGIQVVGSTFQSLFLLLGA